MLYRSVFGAGAAAPCMLLRMLDSLYMTLHNSSGLSTTPIRISGSLLTIPPAERMDLHLRAQVENSSMRWTGHHAHIQRNREVYL